MDVTELLYKLAVVPHIEVVITLLPEMVVKVPTQAKTRLEWGTLDTRKGTDDQTPRHSLLQRFESVGKQTALRFTEQEVHMLWHDHIRVDAKSEAAPHALQREFEDSFGRGGGEQRPPVITGECNEVAVPGFLKPFQSRRHGDRLRARTVPTQAKTWLEWGTVRERGIGSGNEEGAGSSYREPW